MDSDEGAQAPSYCKVTAREVNGTSSARPSFDPPPHLKDQIYQDELNKDKGMEMEVTPLIQKWLELGNLVNASLKLQQPPGM
jgi:hypothetical protein